MIFSRREIALTGAVLAGYVLLLIWVPAIVPPEPGVSSAAAVQGYSNPAAYRAALVWSLVVLAVFAVWGRRLATWTGTSTGDPPVGLPDDSPDGTVAPIWARPGWAALAVGVFFVLAYFPPVLARGGPFVEDSLMLSVLHRMASGQVPYADFEFLYGPLLIYPAHWWMQTFGYSMGAYYGFYSLLQACGFALLAWTVLTLWRGQPAKAWLIFLVMVPFFFDTLLGINWFGVRRLLPLLLLVAAAQDTARPARVVGLGVGAGLLLAYSHDYGVGALLGLAALFGVVALSERSVSALRRGAAVGALAVLVWWASTALILGPAQADYVSTTRELVGRFSLGEAGFRFYWTLGSLSLFTLLSVALMSVGSALPALGRWRLSTGDRLLLMTTVYALVLLKAGLNRADVFHIVPPFLGLAFATLLPLPRTVFQWGRGGRAMAVGATAVAALCTFVGNLPGASFLAQGELAGVRALVGGEQRGPEAGTRARTRSIMTDQVQPDASLQGLASFLAAPERADRPVYFYGRLYALHTAVGIDKLQYMNDDFMYSDERGDNERTFLVDNPTALVLISKGQWLRVLDPAAGDAAQEYADFLRPTVTKRLIAVLSSVHFDGVPVELAAREDRWRRTVGGYLVEAGYRSIAEFGDVEVLARD